MANIENQNTFSNRQVIAIIIFIVVATFTLTMIYASFLQYSADLKSHKSTTKIKFEELKDRIEYVNDRLTRKLK
jgi:TRAP-type C4-dicarboxylate transport system permease small subunit